MKFIQRRTNIIIVGLISVLVGVGLARFLSGVSFAVVLVAALGVMIVGRKKTLVYLAIVTVLGISIGLWRGSVFMNRLEPYRLLTGKEVVIAATVQSDAIYDEYNRQLSFDVHEITILQPNLGNVPGKIIVSGSGENAVYRGDKLQINGKISRTIGGRQARMSFSSFTSVARDNSLTEKIRRWFVAGMATALPEPSASFGLGLVLGYRATLPDTTNDQLAITGLTHIIAVSGYNLTILVRGTRRLMSKRSKYQQIVTASFLIVGFLLVTDFSASIVRASLVSGLSLLAWYYGRKFRPMMILAAVAVLTAVWNPLYLWSDIGWYLSFLAFFGILVIAPLLSQLVYGKREQKSQLLQLVIETTTAQIMTAPLILFIFGRASIIGIVSNIVIGPLVPIAMLLAFVAGVAGGAAPILAGYVAWPARILLRYILELVQLFSRAPYAAVERSITWQTMVALYIAILAGIHSLQRRLMQKYGTITDKNMII